HISFILYNAISYHIFQKTFTPTFISERVVSNIANGISALPEEGTFFERTAYNRPMIDFLFSHTEIKEREEPFAMKFINKERKITVEAFPEMIEAIKELIK